MVSVSFSCLLILSRSLAEQRPHRPPALLRVHPKFVNAPLAHCLPPFRDIPVPFCTRVLYVVSSQPISSASKLRATSVTLGRPSAAFSRSKPFQWVSQLRAHLGPSPTSDYSSTSGFSRGYAAGQEVGLISWTRTGADVAIK
jgi:hypothetical protein